MDVAYDQITNSSLSPTREKRDPRSSTTPDDPTNTTQASSSSPPSQASTEQSHPDGADLNTELQAAWSTVSNTAWGSAIGGWWSTARKQGEKVVADLQKEAQETQKQATKGFESLRDTVVQRTRALTIDEQKEDEAGATKASVVEEHPDRPESLPADIAKEASSLVASFRTTAAARLKALKHAEDAADEALLKFGSNVRNFLRDAVVISAPADEDSDGSYDAMQSELLFETREPGTGKKVIHSTRLDAQLHAIHTSVDSLSHDPEEAGAAWQEWCKDFDAGKRTEQIAADLERYPQLRSTMEKLVPEKVEYGNFWRRYYFLREAVVLEEKRRKEVLKGAAQEAEEEVGWDESDDDEDEPSKEADETPNSASASTTTLTTPAQPANASSNSTTQLNPSSRPSSEEHERQSVAEASEASYDLVSGAQSGVQTRAANSPKRSGADADKETAKGKGDGEDSDDDWE